MTDKSITIDMFLKCGIRYWCKNNICIFTDVCIYILVYIYKYVYIYIYVHNYFQGNLSLSSRGGYGLKQLQEVALHHQLQVLQQCFGVENPGFQGDVTLPRWWFLWFEVDVWWDDRYTYTYTYTYVYIYTYTYTYMYFHSSIIGKLLNPMYGWWILKVHWPVVLS